MALILKQIVTALSCEFIELDSSILINTISVDSRSHQNAESTLFFALVGPHHDAHQYIETLIAQGVKSFVVQTVDEKWLGKANFLKVVDTLEALQLFAAYYRSLFSFPVIGITGSNGKTIVKEWLNFLLSPDYTIIRSPKSYNSQVGVPLSIIGINEMHNLGIFEAGISTVNEMRNLQKIIQPTIGILTNIGSAHDEGFLNISQKIREKLKLFDKVEVLILNKSQVIEDCLNKSIKTFTWSTEDKSADVFFQKKIIGQNTIFTLFYKDFSFKIQLPFIDEASLENSIHCILTMLYLGYDQDIIQERIAELYPVEMRLKIKNGIYNCTLIDDSYSSDFESLKIALDFLQNQRQHKKRTLIISDIFQSGLPDEELYSRVAQLIVSNRITRVICIGSTITKFKNLFLNTISFESTASFVNTFDTLDFSDETILIKGARVFEFEKIVSLLEEKKHETVLEINLNSLSHNFNYYKTKIKSTTKIMGMVKAFGYGSGSFEIAKLLAHHKVDYLGVAFADEGIELKKAGIEVPIMVMNPEMTSFKSIIKHGLEPEIYSLRGLKAFIKILEEKKKEQYPIHIKINTGMNRLGFDEEVIPDLIEVIQTNKWIKIKTILSHFAESDNAIDKTFSLKQIRLFDILSNQIINVLDYKPIRHICNSSGISNYPEGEFDMVRLGVGMYGVSNDLTEMKYLETVGTLKSVISQIRTLKIGDTVGYNRRFVVEKPMRMAVIPVGYADGISRKWGRGVGYLLVNGQKAPILGSICMDMLMIDVTNIACAEGNEVIIFGKDLPVTVIATAIDTIPYEILTGISRRVSRIFYRE
ncbi:bifunctional UDP-N-acetylmuramoyl-tripeptide:D-alanyl-D-alanine ligase/alanine racemase [Flavobacterium oreochromis]|uniref:Alanine racemase n=1 Tax=Flavobacterium oreochromis TaxID=2906078 RepID=A0ABW8P5Q2_9FLAO|nr:bifunctional UDP-N-acetylmuramoyl-tripeptide:D-alanyl-D-alanine ligase/alanine racemase [Flavobacterium oreochromis]OWP76421.1 bifunctional UDP-N-acetylmuramoyl-tripeptide:D-alanyl-D-alanine ligase/alanine racemase [Flavobacterium oreochromis]